MLHQAVDVQISRSISDCTSDAGFEFFVTDQNDISVPFRRYGLLPAEQWTYLNNFGVPVYIDAESTEYVPTEAEEVAYNAALFGTQDSSGGEVRELRDDDGNRIGTFTSFGGCLEFGQAQLFGTIERYGDYVQLDTATQILVSESFEDALSDRAHVDAASDWQKCMSDHGFDFSTPLEPLAYDWTENPQRLEPGEIASRGVV